MNKSFDFENKEFETQPILSQLDNIAKNLIIDEKIQNKTISSSQLGSIVTKLIHENEKLFGLTSKDENIKNQMTKLDSELFKNFQINGSLHLILKTYFLNKQEMMNDEFDFNNKARVVELMKKIKGELEKNNFLNQRVFNFSTNVTKEDAQKYANIITKFGGKIDTKNFTHLIDNGDLKPLQEYKPVDYIKNQKTLIHWTNFPNSYNKWINKPTEEILIKPTKKIWKLSGKFLVDSERFNEWMEESDYDLEPTTQKRKITFDEVDSKKLKDDLKPEDFKTPIVVPFHATWFNIDEINEIEKRSLPEFFDSQSTTKTPEIYQQYRNFMIETFRKDSDKYLSATECRKYLAGDISSIIRVFSFLEHWGLINYGVSPDKFSGTEQPSILVHEYTPSEKLVSLELPSFGVQPTYTVPIPKITDKGDWNQEEVLRLLKSIEVHKDDWNKISSAVGSRTKEECLSYFLKMPIEDEFILQEPKIKETDPLPFSDSHNPIMQTVAFLASMVHPTVAASAAQAALQSFKSLDNPNIVDLKNQELDTKTMCSAAIGAASAKAKVLAIKEEREIQRLIALILEKQMKKVEFKLKQLDHLEKLMNKERYQMEENKKKLEQEKLQFMAEKMNGKESNGKINGSEEEKK